jgi:RNA polymerase sigma factor (sigma-70 family)
VSSPDSSSDRKAVSALRVKENDEPRQVAIDMRDDRAWLDAFRRGERPALERTFRTYANLVMVVLRRGTRSRDAVHFAPGIDDEALVEDLLHDIFLEAFKADVRARYDGLRPYAPFLVQIARHRLFDHARKNGRLRAHEVLAQANESADAFATDDDEAPDAQLLAREERAQVTLFKSTLSDDERAFVRTRFEDGASQDESARLLSRSRQQIRTLEQKIRERFHIFMRNLRDTPTRNEPADEGDEQNPSP